jgi:hypothetical protein
MDLKPFIRLPMPRMVSRPELSSGLAEFYAWHEGVGLESSPDRPVRLCKLDEVTRVGWKDLLVVSDVPEGWERFAAFRIGRGMFFDDIVYVLEAPSCPPGSILAIGRDLCGPGGDGPFRLESSLVLAATFPAWLAHLERWGWVEYAVAGWEPPPEPQEIDQYYRALNPGLGA